MLITVRFWTISKIKDRQALPISPSDPNGARRDEAAGSVDAFRFSLSRGVGVLRLLFGEGMV